MADPIRFAADFIGFADKIILSPLIYKHDQLHFQSKTGEAPEVKNAIKHSVTAFNKNMKLDTLSRSRHSKTRETHRHGNEIYVPAP